MKTYEQINARIESGKAVVLTADEIMDYVDKKGLEAAAKEVDVVTTATFGPMCSSGCFINFGHSKPKIRMSEAWIEDVLVYTGIAAVDVYLGATQLRHGDPANMYHPGEFRYGGGHVIEDLVAGKSLQLFALSYGTDEYPRREIRTYFTIDDLNGGDGVPPNPQVIGTLKCCAVKITVAGTYTSPGGDALTPAAFGLNKILGFFPEPLSSALVIPLYDYTNSKLKFYEAGTASADLDECDNGDDVAGSFRAMVFGF